MEGHTSDALDLVPTPGGALSLASHEVRNAITSLRVGLSFLQRTDPATPLAEVHEDLRLVAEQVDRLARLISDLFDQARISAGQLHLERRPVDLRDLVPKVVEREQQRANEHHIAVQIADAPLRGYWDPVRLEQALTNLLDNAIKYTPPGTPITCRIEAVQDGVTVTVADQGPGLPTSIRQRPFERFLRGEHSLSGLGLGLYIARGIVEAHGGRIGLESAPEQGCCVWFTLPTSHA